MFLKPLKMKTNYDCIIIGGGLVGLVAAIQLSKNNVKVLLIEKKIYPFHRVCGEYISNETLPFLKNIGLDVYQLGAANISKFQLTSPSGKMISTTLEMGGFGISRYTLDNALYKLALQTNVEVLTNTTVDFVEYFDDFFEVKILDGQVFTSKYVLGAYGKRSKLDVQLKRSFFVKESPYLAVKYHIKTDFAKDTIALHNFDDGYCGISAIESGIHCLCYLTTRKQLRKYKTIDAMEKAVLWKNPYLKKIFTESTFLFDKPLVINEISFSKKSIVENHIVMMGDAAGLITPLCGNGMSMAIHSAKLLTDNILGNKKSDFVVLNYKQQWKKLFARRLLIGRIIQSLFGKPLMTEIVVLFFGFFKPLLNLVVKSTHGKAF